MLFLRLVILGVRLQTALLTLYRMCNWCPPLLPWLFIFTIRSWSFTRLRIKTSLNVKRVKDADFENESSMSEEIMDGTGSNSLIEGLPPKDLLKRFHILQGERVETYALFEEYVFMLFMFCFLKTVTLFCKSSLLLVWFIKMLLLLTPNIWWYCSRDDYTCMA